MHQRKGNEAIHRGHGLEPEQGGGKSRSGPGGSEAGAGTVLTLGISLGTIILILAVLALAQAAVGAARAGTAADLAALAGADTLRALRAGDPCMVAAEVAARNGAALAGCSPDPGTASLTVEVRFSRGTVLPWPTTARARAGPPG